MSKEDGTESERSSSESSEEESRQSTNTPKSSKKKHSKSAKPRLTALQKNTNHKDAENKRRNAIRERFTELSHMVPGAEGQERSEQVMLGKTAEFLKQMLEEQRQLEAMADAQGVALNPQDRLKDTDYGGPKWKTAHMEEYQAQKTKKGNSWQSGGKGEDDD